MQSFEEQMRLVELAEADAPGLLTCGCVVCGHRARFTSRREAASAGWRALGGNQSELVCPGCLAERDRRAASLGNRAQRRAAASAGRRAR